MSKRNRRTKVASPSASYPGPIERGLSKSYLKGEIEGIMESIMYGWGGADVTKINVTPYGVDFEFTGYAELPYEDEDEPSEDYSEEYYEEESEPEPSIPSQQQRILAQIDSLLDELKSLLQQLHDLDPTDANTPDEKDRLTSFLVAVNTKIRDVSGDLYGDALDEFKGSYQEAVVSVGGAWTQDDNDNFDEIAAKQEATLDAALSWYDLNIYPIYDAINKKTKAGETMSIVSWKQLKAKFDELFAKLESLIASLSVSYTNWFWNSIGEIYGNEDGHTPDGKWSASFDTAMEEAEEAASAVKPGDYLMENGSPIPNAVFLAGFIKGIEKARKDKGVQEKYGKDYKTGDPLPPSEIFKWIYNSARGWARNIDKLSAAQRDGLNTPLGLRKPKAQRSGVASPIIKAEIYKEIAKLKGVNKASLPGKAKFVAEFGFSEGYQDQDSNEAYAHSNHKRKKASLLREATIKLAHSNPELRKHLIPLLMEDED